MIKNTYLYRVTAAYNQIDEIKKESEKDLQKLLEIRSKLVRLREVFILWPTDQENI